MPQKIPAIDVLHRLNKLYHPPKTFLKFRTPLELLIATVLSAQCTDTKVNEVTPGLFGRYRGARAFAEAPIKELETAIRSTGFYRTKARHIQALCRMLLENHRGKVPGTMEELLALPGVGRKTAAIILSAVFGKNEYIAVDTHVFRLARRLGLSRGKNPDRVAADLMQGLPRKEWGRITPLFISHGRAVCTAKNRQCEQCVFKKQCPSSLMMGKPDLYR